MISIESIYKRGNGPSSSHTVGPYNAAKLFKKRYKDADKYDAILYGSLADTGDGHGTDKAISDVLINVNISHNQKEKNLKHPNTFDLIAYKNNCEIGRLRFYSIGGGSIKIDGEENRELNEVYKEKNFTEIIETCKKENTNIAEYVYKREPNVKKRIKKMWKYMQDTIERGLKKDGVLPGGLNVERKAKKLYEFVSHNESNSTTRDRLISAFAYATCEENASENVIVTAPTCGACGIIPSIFYYMKKYKGYSDDEIVDALTVGAVIGNVIRTNASISGAECGCQAEVGSATSMAAGALAHLYGLNIDQIECAAEVAMEHCLGLTCDPIGGLVQIPCIERNAVYAGRAISAVNLSRFLYMTRKISFDTVVETMYETGKDLDTKYKETAHGGLAKLYKNS